MTYTTPIDLQIIKKQLVDYLKIDLKIALKITDTYPGKVVIVYYNNKTHEVFLENETPNGIIIAVTSYVEAHPEYLV